MPYADLNDPQSPDGRRDEVEQRPIADLGVDDHAVLLEDADLVGGRDRAVALVLDPLQVFRGEVGRLEVDARMVRVQLVPNRSGSVDLPDEAGHDVLGGVVPHVGVSTIPINRPADRADRRQAIDVMPNHAFLLRHPEHLRLLAGPGERAGVVRLASPFRVEGGAVEDYEVGTDLQDVRVELPQVARVRILPSAVLHVQDLRLHLARGDGPEA